MVKLLLAASLGLLCVSSAYAQSNATAPAPSGNSTSSSGVAFAPTQEVTASAPNPTAYTRTRTGNYALDSLANTATSYNQIQTLGVYSAAHVTPNASIVNYLAGVSGISGLTSSGGANATQFTQVELYNQLEDFGARSFHFRIYYDPTAPTRYQVHAGLAIVNATTANTTVADEKWSYPGWKVMNEPNFDFNTTCVNLFTCLFNIKNWILSTPNTVPLTIFLEPSTFTYTGTDSNATFAAALNRSTTTGAPSSLNQPLNITSYEPAFQPWRDLENEILNVFDQNSYFSIVTPDDIMDDEDNLKSAVIKENYTLYPSLNNLKSRIFFVLTGEYVSNYLEYYPDLKNATLFVSEPYNADGNYTNSTLFVDFLGPLTGANGTSFNSTAARNSSQSIAAQITSAVQAGYMVRASADWQTVEPRNNYSLRATDVLAAGAHFVQTTFPTTPTFFPSTYSLALPVRGNQKQSTRCNPLTTGGVFFNATEVYTVGCPALSSSPAGAPSASI